MVTEQEYRKELEKLKELEKELEQLKAEKSRLEAEDREYQRLGNELETLNYDKREMKLALEHDPQSQVSVKGVLHDARAWLESTEKEIKQIKDQRAAMRKARKAEKTQARKISQ